MQSLSICSRLLKQARQATLPCAVHSVFEHAVNLEAAGRHELIGLIAADKPLTPFALSVRNPSPFSALGIRAGMETYFDAERVRIPQAGVSIDVTTARTLDLSVDSVPISPDANPLASVSILIETLGNSREASAGVSPLVTNADGNVYTSLLKPRLGELAEAVREVDAQKAAHAAARFAGCGPGLTPSSDDFLVGYFAALRALSNAGRIRDVREILPIAAQSAAAKTNRISGTFLLQSGSGLVSSALLELLKVIFSGGCAAAIQAAAIRVGAVGSTSGSDTLSGLAFAILQHDGGKNSGSAGNQKKCLL